MKKIKLTERDLRSIISKVMNESQLLLEKPCKASNNIKAQGGQNWADCGGNRQTCKRAEYGWAMECQSMDMIRDNSGGGDQVCCPAQYDHNGDWHDCCKSKGVDMLSTKGSGFKTKQGTSHRLEKFMRMNGLNERYGDESTTIDTGKRFWACHEGKGECVNQDDASGGLYGDEKRYSGLFAKWRCNKNCGE